MERLLELTSGGTTALEFTDCWHQQPRPSRGQVRPGAEV